MDIAEKYRGNKEFRDYVDRYSKQYIEGRSISVEEALSHEIVKEYARWLDERGSEKC